MLKTLKKKSKKKRKKKARHRNSALVVDYGGDGGVFVKSDSGLWRCVGCDHRQYVSRKALDRKTRPKCQDCGDLLYPDKQKPRKSRERAEPAVRRCKDCHAVLRSGNTGEYCAPCMQRPGWYRRA